jgi:2-methylaconitate cis-trans-isomerase PrpF
MAQVASIRPRDYGKGKSVTRFIKAPCVMMRGGTSRGPYFRATDLPSDPAERDRFLVSVMGAGHELQVDGIGGGNPLTSKVAIVGPPTHPHADVDYLFAQVGVMERSVDTSPNCGNMLSGVGPFAIEQGLVPAGDGTTTVRIHNVNTGKLIEADIQTPGGRITYEGSARIDGVPGTAAPIHLTFLDAAGAKTGSLLPSGHAIDVIDGIETTLIDAAMPLIILRARDMGKSAQETPAELDSDRAFMQRLQAIRLEAGRLMGLGDVAHKVIPKPVIIGNPSRGGDIAARYFVPHSCHKALAVTGSVGIATACATPGTLASAFLPDATLPRSVTIEHPSGSIELRLSQRPGETSVRVSLLRTARRLFEGTVFGSIDEVPCDPPRPSTSGD